MNSRTIAAPVAVMLAALLIWGGCGGSSSTSTTPAQPGGATITIEGRVVEADNPAVGLAQAIITALPSGRTTSSVQSQDLTTNGTFSLVVPLAATITLQVNPVDSPTYQAAAILIESPDATTDKIVRVSVSLLPQGAPTPTSIGLSPQNNTVEIGSIVQFTGTVETATGPASYTPSWLTLGPAGLLSSTGLFTASSTTTGVNRIYAFSGAVGATTDITVVGQRGPSIDSVTVDPLQVSASGGLVTFTIAASDGEGVASVVATIYPPGGGTVTQALTQVAGGVQSATFRTTYSVPPNSNVIVDGVQAPQAYNVRFTATDNTSHTTLSDYIPFTVLGLGPPPPPPSG
jgi:hypothetical protein